ncbi:MAG: hypothetical protein GF364_16795 [Candidatus Lokiarchaeota archaeon]|nr:hypothetical protein [Candidatus Lokiarchaeota archaeon]
MKKMSVMILWGLAISILLTMGTIAVADQEESPKSKIAQSPTYGNLVQDSFFESSTLDSSPWTLSKWANEGSIDAEDTAMINDIDDQLMIQIHDDAAVSGEDTEEFVQVWQYLPKKYTYPGEQTFDVEIGYHFLVTGGDGVFAETTSVLFEFEFSNTVFNTVKTYSITDTTQPFWKISDTYTTTITIPDSEASANNYETDYFVGVLLYAESICYEQYSRLFFDYVAVKTNYYENPVDITPPAKVSLSSPSDGATLTQDNTPTFEWGSVADAVEYQIQVDDANTFSSPAIDSTTSNTYYTSSPLGDDEYYWHVRAKDDADNWGDWSNIWSFTIDTTGPEVPSLSSPSDGATLTQDNTPTFEWGSVADAVEYQIQVDDANTFNSPLINSTTSNTYYISSPLSDGEYYWRVRAKDDADNWGDWSNVWIFEIITETTTPPPETTTPPPETTTPETTNYPTISGTINSLSIVGITLTLITIGTIILVLHRKKRFK